MQESELLQEGLALMGLGMGFVFVFLTVLVISVTLMSKLIGRFQPAPVAAPSGRNNAKPSAPKGQDDEVKAVISAAVHRYRSSRRK
ncbi:OadG family protein [Vreelandella venusta]|jgi:oxaloacetate decarboxylase gamma subunit|uniref:Probable oxaloacetate decarboxylase gamma chain n=1 Tax=Vreelandella venusta TaxID=44935 RepID=A0AAQ0CHY8_9GAMM|nr:OadG family transporter subunit [Halomonas venusta]AZM94818.1 sodium pump decarboxylase subunit gamma [Halomonas venusta]MDW0358616.1 OadG family transporter subunit [Halomonas venusta]MDX1713271.1 OadG family transporter subunit [Halomonas venusta]NPT29315.1 sodium pump decarboxylase subunit gamma [Halomonas venusta]QPI64852.1 OadG family protein [Halomonas venusta]